jgi:lipopolysaccharide/colanic/teichoic acid biosynthesis glycosyltransferase
MYPAIKRFLDILIAGIALIILLPVFIPIIIILLLTGEHEVFYLQQRIGYKGKPFYIWKFATMIKDSPNIGSGEITLRNDPRVTRVGKFLRITKINELPQLINVLKGEMSMVGPRPLMEVSFRLYDEEARRNIYNTRPGITGIGSLIFRDEEKIVSGSADPRQAYIQLFPYKAALEYWYRQHASVLTDIKIIFLTGWMVILPNSKLIQKTFRDLPPRPATLYFV